MMSAGTLATLLGVWCSLVQADPNTRMCIKNTGGLCISSPCYTWRAATGAVTCESGGRCFCDSKSCSGVDGSCWDAVNSSYAVVNTSATTWYKFQNSRKPDLYLRTASSTDADCGVGCVVNTAPRTFATKDVDDESYFSIVMPQAGNGGTSFLIYSKKWADYLLNFQAVKNGFSVVTRGIIDLAGSSQSLTALLVDIVKAPQDVAPGALMFKKYGSPYYAYITMMHTPLVGVGTHDSDPGAGGYWFPEPALPDEIMSRLPVYTGSRCSMFCGDPQEANAAASTSLAQVVLMAVFSMGLLSCSS